MTLAHAIIGTSFYSSGGGGGASPYGRINWNGTSSSFSAATGSAGSISSHPYSFPDGTTTSTIAFNSFGSESTYSLGSVGNFWLDFWIYPTSLGVSILAEADNDISPGYYYNMLEIDNDGHIYAGVWNGGNTSNVITTDKVTVNAWNHLYFYFNSGTLGLAINGGTPAEITSVTRSGPGNTFLHFGWGTVTAMFTGNNYQGYMDAIYGSTTSMASRYSSTKSKYKAQPIFALLASSYTSNNTWVDSVAGNRFTMHNNPTWLNTNSGQIRFTAANSEYADCSTSLAQLDSFTIQGVFKLNSLPATNKFPQIFTETYISGAHLNYALGFINNQANIDFGFFDASSGYWNNNNLTAVAPSLNTWYDVVGTYNGPTKELKVYLNGTEVANTVTSGMPVSSGSGIRVARRWDDTDYIDGVIKDINIWSGAMTPSEVSNQHIPYNSLV